MTNHDHLFSVQVADLSKRFNREWIFRNLNYDFRPGSKYAVTGPNGSGKSTLLQVLSGHVPPSSGTIRYSKNNKVIPADDIYRHISIAAPYLELIDELTLTEHLRFHFKLKRIREGKSISDLLDVLYLQDARDKYISNFSSGMKQRLKLGLAMYTATDLLLLDEPGNHLDHSAFQWYLSELGKIPSQTIVIIASNNPMEYPANTSVIHLPDWKK